MANNSSTAKIKIPERFKCPYCFKNIPAEGVAFRSMTAYTQQDMDALEEQSEIQKKSIYQQSVDKLYEEFWKKYPGSKPVGTAKNPTYDRHPVLSRFDDRYITDAKFTDGSHLTFKKDADGFTYEAIDTEGASTKIRICPHCHNKLPFEFGKYPVKFVCVVGITSSGKTVFLSQMLGKIHELLLNVNMTVAGLCPEVDEFVSGYMIRRGENLPVGNASNVLTKPIPINVKSNVSGERYTFVFYDIAGENCVVPEQMEKYGPFIQNADGIIMVVDPRQFPDLLYLSGEDESEMEETYNPDRVVRAMYEAFGSAGFEGGKCNVPLAATISKSDLLKGCQYVGENSNIFRDIAYNEYSGKKGFPYDDWRNINAEVKMLFSKRSNKGLLLHNTLEQFFPAHSYFAVSALNGSPKVYSDGNTKRYQMEVLPKTVRIEEPLYWLMFKMGIIEKMEKGDNSGGGFFGIFKRK